MENANVSFCHKWEIENIKILFEDNKAGQPCLTSSNFTPQNDKNYEFHLIFYPKGQDEESKDHISLYLVLSNSNSIDKVTVLSKFAIIDCTGLLYNTQGMQYIFTKLIGDNFCGHMTYIPVKEILNFQNQLLTDNKLTLLCVGEIIKDGVKLSDLTSHYHKSFIDKIFNNVPTTNSNFNMNKTIPFAHQWTIDKFSNLINGQLTGQPIIESSNFSPPNNYKYQFNLQMYPMGIDEDNKNYIGVYFQMAPESLVEKVTVQLKFSLINCAGEKTYTKDGQGEHIKNSDTKSRGFAEFISRDLDLKFKNELLKNDKFILLCEGEIILDGNKLSKTNLDNHYYVFANKRHLRVQLSTSYFNVNPQTIPFTHQWTIENITNLISDPLTKHPSIDSPKFSPLNYTKYQFKLRMYPKGENEENKHNISLFFELVSSLQDKIAVQFKFSIIDCDGDTCDTKGGCRIFIKNSSNIWRFQKVTSHETLLNHKKLLKNGKLTLLCEGEVILDGANFSKTEREILYQIFKNKQINLVQKSENQNFEKLDQIQNLLSKLIENNLLQVKMKNTAEYNFSNASLENVIFTCDNSSNTMRDFIVSNGMKDFDLKLFINNIDQTIKANIKHLLPLMTFKQQSIVSQSTKINICYPSTSKALNTEKSIILDKVPDFEKILSKLIENNLLQIKLRNSYGSKHDFSNATLENVKFSSISEAEFTRIVSNEKHLSIPQSDSKQYFENLDHLIKSNFEQLIPVLQNCFQLRFIIKNWNYKLDKQKKYVVKSINSNSSNTKSRPDILSQLNSSEIESSANKKSTEEHDRKIDEIIEFLNKMKTTRKDK